MKIGTSLYAIRSVAWMECIMMQASAQFVEGLRILVGTEDGINEIADHLKSEGIVVRYNKKSPHTTTTVVTTLGVDQAYALAMELEEDTKEEVPERKPVVLATYFNSNSAILSYTSIFEMLWIQNEIYNDDPQQK